MEIKFKALKKFINNKLKNNKTAKNNFCNF